MKPTGEWCSVIPLTVRAASRKPKLLVAKLKLKGPRSHAEVGVKPGEHN